MLKVFYSDQYINSKTFLFYVFEKYFNLKLNEKDIIINKYGKPYLNNNLYYNISHTANIIVIAVSNNEIGIDAELLTRKISDTLINKYFKNEYENTFDIIKLWTKKESFVKYLGKSMFTEIKNIKIKENLIIYKNEVVNINSFNYTINNIYINIITNESNFEFINLNKKITD